MTHVPVRVEAEDLLPHLERAAPGDVLVIVAPPGSGKSAAMYEATRRLLLARMALHRYRVLWATHGTRKDKSLGQEAYQHLSALLPTSLNLFVPHLFKNPLDVVHIIYGQDHCDETGINYYEQFERASNMAVSIISHAHLPLILQNQSEPRVEKLLDNVGLIVVDEDPVGSLTYTLSGPPKSKGAQQSPITEQSPVTDTFLHCREVKGMAGNIEVALSRLMTRAKSGEFARAADKVPNGIKRTTLHSLTGTAFWTALVQELAGATPEFVRFRQAVDAAAGAEAPVPDDFYLTFEADLLDVRQTSARFGLTWVTDQDELVTQMQFRGDVLRVLPGNTPPIVVLDAYANSELQQYERMFPNHRVRYIQDWAYTPLDIEYVDDTEDEEALNIDRQNMLAGKQRKLRDYLMAETGELTRCHKAGTVVLSYTNITDFLVDEVSYDQWSWRFDPPLPEGAVQVMWWFSGRGVNAFDGRHVVVWHSPERPKTFQLHTLAALAPHSPRDRGRLADHAFQSELLQMAHRGRQTNYPEGDPDEPRPRVVLFFNPGELPSAWATLRKYTPHLNFTRNSPNPLHRAAVQAVAGDLLKLYGGVPHACLAGVGLYRFKPQERKLWGVAEAKLRRKLTSTAKAQSAMYLQAWAASPHRLQHLLGPFSAADGANTQLALTIFGGAADPRLRSLQNFDVPVPSRVGRSTTRVYAPSWAEAEDALSRLLR